MGISKFVFFLTMVMPTVTFAHVNRGEAVWLHFAGHSLEAIGLFLCAVAAFVGYHYWKNSG